MSLDDPSRAAQAEPSGDASRIGAVEAPALAPEAPQALAGSADFQAMETRLNESVRIASANDRRSLYHLEQELTAILSELSRTYRFAGMMIASGDGLVVAKSEALERDAVLGALAALCVGVAARVKDEAVLDSVSEIAIRSQRGARLTIRSFLGADEPLLLVAVSPHAAPRMATDDAISRCSSLLHSFLSPLDAPAAEPASKSRAESWRRAIRRFLAPLATSTLVD